MVEILYACMILFPLGISLRMSLRLLYGARGPQVDDPIHQIISVAASILTVAPMIVFVLAMSSGFGILLIILLVSAGIDMLLARREMQRQSAWELVNGDSTGQTLSVPTLGQHQNRFTGIIGRAYRRFIAAVDSGVDLRTAIGSHHKAFPPEAQAYAAINAIATLEVPTIENDDDPQKHQANQHVAQQWTSVESQLALTMKQLIERCAYLLMIVLFMLGIGTFILIKIVPSFEKIFDDFELELPEVTLHLISVSSLFTGFPFLNFFLGASALLLILTGIPISICYLCDIPVLRPLTDRLFFTRHRALVLRLLAVATEQKKPFAQICEELVGYQPHYPSRLVRNRLTAARRHLSAGHDWKEALQINSFINAADIPMLQTAQTVGNLPWVLRTLANQKMRRLVIRWSAIEQILFPCLVIVVGLAVAFFCIALFIPLVQLIYALT